MNKSLIPTELNKLMSLLSAGKFSEAETLARSITKRFPMQGVGWKALGVLLQRAGKTAEALTPFKKAAELLPNDAEAHNNLGIALKNADQLEEAEACYRQALAIKPDYAEAHYNLGINLKALGRPFEAETSYRKALEININYADAYYNLAMTLNELGQLNEAETCYQQLLKIKPDYYKAYNNLGIVYYDQDNPDKAIESYNQSLKINPNYAEAHNNMGAALRKLNRVAEANVCFYRALECDQNLTDAHQNLAITSAYLSDFDKVVQESDLALTLDPDAIIAWEQRLYAFSYHPDLTAQEIFSEFVRWGDRFPDPVIDFSTHDRSLSRRLRIGYVSPDFRQHTSRFFFFPLFTNHDHTQVELFAYSNVRNEDEFTHQFKKEFDHWRNIRGISDQDVARMVREDKIDILVDACSHMLDDRLGLFTLKPAPIQVTWLGAAWTTGLKMMDYALIDPYLAPEGTLTRESIIQLPHSFVAYAPPSVTAEIVSPPCLKNGYVTFGYSGRTERLNHRTFRVWGEILKQNPTARLILDFRTFGDPQTQTYYRQFMLKHGMNPNQVQMRCSENIFEGLNDFDILLDCFPHSGGTMLFDALWMGVPVLTLASRPPVGRIGTTLMINLDLPEWVSSTEGEYIHKAKILAQNTQQLAQLRAGMRQRMQNSPLMDGPGFARAVESAYRTIYEKWVNSFTDTILPT